MIPSTQDPRVVSWEGVCQVLDPSAQSFCRFWALTWKGSVGSRLVLFGVCQWEIRYFTCFGFPINTIRRAAIMVALCGRIVLGYLGGGERKIPLSAKILVSCGGRAGLMREIWESRPRKKWPKVAKNLVLQPISIMRVFLLKTCKFFAVFLRI